MITYIISCPDFSMLWLTSQHRALAVSTETASKEIEKLDEDFAKNLLGLHDAGLPALRFGKMKRGPPRKKGWILYIYTYINIYIK